MEVDGRRSGISQSMDLFIIIAAVLGVGGVVTASIYNLVQGATTNSSVAVVEASLKAGTSPGAPPEAISISVKNDGGSPISCTAPTSCQVVFAGTDAGTNPTCSPPCSVVSGGPEAWSLQAATGPLTFFAESTVPLDPGAQSSFVLNGAIATKSGSFWASGAPVTINVLFGSASAEVTVVSG